MTYVPARIDAQRAQAFFARRRWGNLFGLWGRPAAVQLLPATEERQFPCIERIWIPHYRIDFSVVSKKGPGKVSVSVEACSGCFAFFQMHDGLVEAAPGEECLPILLPEEDAIRHGRSDLLKAIMRRRSQENKPIIQEALDAQVFHYPFWVYYFKRRGKYIDIRLMDAYSGERGGNRTRQGVLNAFVAMRNAKYDREQPDKG